MGNIPVVYFASLKILIQFSCLETRLIRIWKKVCEYHAFHILKVCVFHKKTATCTRLLQIGKKKTYPDIFHKIFYVSHEWIVRYFLCNSLGFSYAAPPLASSSIKDWLSEGFKSQTTFSLASLGMVHHSFLVFFARLTMFTVKLEQHSEKIIHLVFSFCKQNTVESQWHEDACAQ